MSSDFWAGYISGAAGILIGNPLDLVKVRLQAGQFNDPIIASPQARGGGYFEALTSFARGVWYYSLGFLPSALLTVFRCRCPDFGIWSSKCSPFRGL